MDSWQEAPDMYCECGNKCTDLPIESEQVGKLENDWQVVWQQKETWYT